MTRTDIEGIPSIVQQILWFPLLQKVYVRYFDGSGEMVNINRIPKVDFDYWMIEHFLISRKMSTDYDRQIKESS